MKDGVDLVVSGINEGPNLGNDVFISVTVGAALQGYFYDIPSLAISIAALENINFDVAARLAGLLAAKVRDGFLSSKLLLNVNLPNLPAEEIKGIVVTKLGRRNYSDIVQEGHDGRRNYYWLVRGKSRWQRNRGTDIQALMQKKVSITPLAISLPPAERYPMLKRLSSTLIRELRSVIHQENE